MPKPIFEQGTQDLLLREQWGDARAKVLMARTDRSVNAHSKLVERKATIRAAISFGVVSTALTGVSWSVWFWVAH